MNAQEKTLTTFDGLTLRGKSWKPDGAPKAVVVLTHGQGEYVGRYEHVGAWFTQNGYAFYAYDLRGHGKSGGPRGHIPSYEAFLNDLEAVLKWAQAENAGRKIFLMGHSMGGQITLNYVLRRKPAIAGVMVTGPWLKLAFDPPAWKVQLGRVLNNLWPTLALPSGLTMEMLSRDLAFLNSMPEVELYTNLVSARMGTACMEAAADALAHAAQFTTPVLFMHGSADQATNPAGTREFYERAASADKTFKSYEGFYHEIHNEPDRARVLADMTNWLSQH